MAYCGNCGKKLDDDALFCPNCGKSVAEPEKTKKTAEDIFNSINNTADTTNEFDPNDIKSNKGVSVLAYFGLLFLVPLLAAKDSKFARFHTNQGIVLFIFSLAFEVVDKILLGIFSWTLYPLYNVAELCLDLIGIAFIVLMIIGIVNAVNGKAKELPIIGKIRILK